MDTYRLAMIGFGNVGQGFAQILAERGPRLARAYGLNLQIVAVCDLLKGSLADPAGLDPAALLGAVQASGRLDSVPAPHRGWDALGTIAKVEADALIELSYTDLKTGEPAITHLRAALERGLHVVTTNKGPIALRYPELKAIADRHGVEIGAEGTVMSGTPSLRLGTEMLHAAGVTCIQGIVNGTTNYILSQMDAGAAYTDALPV
jgi:homoserine dehydrogenase